MCDHPSWHLLRRAISTPAFTFASIPLLLFLSCASVCVYGTKGGSHNPLSSSIISPPSFRYCRLAMIQEQDNTWTASWPEFWADRRIGDLVRRSGDAELAKLELQLREK